MNSKTLKQILHKLPQLISQLKQHRILVVGDVMLDRYWFGNVERISPEAPIPIAKINKIEDRPGGAANVAKNIINLEGNVTLLSVVGNDEAANKLEQLLKSEQINTILHQDNSIQTTVKLRVLAKNQQLIRLDFEHTPSHEILLDILKRYEEIIPEYDLIILSDYGKGGLNHVTQLINLAIKHGKKILIDPKGNDYTKYAKATIITPNKNELREAVGTWINEQELHAKVYALIAKLNLDHLLLTRSEEGMTLFTNNQAYNYPTVAQEVYDVSGAGDTVIATIGLMLANGLEIKEAVELANIAAGIVVGKVGTATLTITELIDKINSLKCKTEEHI